jgi:uncharacterized protein YndB with AHSA1/START domain
VAGYSGLLSQHPCDQITGSTLRQEPTETPAVGSRWKAAFIRSGTTRDEGNPWIVDFTIETEIERTPADVFAYVTDPSKLDTWQTNTVSAVPEPDGPIRLGSRIREVHRAPGGKNMASLVEVAEYEPDRVFGMRMIEGPPIPGQITLTPTERGTRFRFRVYGQPTGAMRLAEPILKFTLKRNFTRFSTALKRVLENSPDS